MASQRRGVDGEPNVTPTLSTERRGDAEVKPSMAGAGSAAPVSQAD
jgi:hypothetical protein